MTVMADFLIFMVFLWIILGGGLAIGIWAMIHSDGTRDGFD
jgi:hypothetical protein